MKSFMQAFLLILQFFTTIPINISLPCELRDFRKGIIFLPVIGGILGLIQYGVFTIFNLFMPVNLSIVIVVIVSVVITGGIHIDGLGDSCDGFYANKGTDRIIEIMKDSRIGTYACLAIIFDVLIKFFSMQGLNDLGVIHMIILAPIISRTGLILLFYIGKTAKKKGTGNFFIGNCGLKEIIIGSIIPLILTFYLLGILPALSIISSVIIFVYVFNKYCIKKIGGLTGDSLGAANELIEMLTLIVIIIVR